MVNYYINSKILLFTKSLNCDCFGLHNTVLFYNPQLIVTAILFLNQVRPGHRPARAWFLEIVSVRTSVCVFACVCVCVCVCVRPEAINN